MYLKITTSDNLQRITRVLDHSLICIGGNFMWLKGSLNCSYFFNLKIFSKVLTWEPFLEAPMHLAWDVVCGSSVQQPRLRTTGSHKAGWTPVP